VAQHLSENTKNPEFTRASHFAGIPKSAHPKLPHYLHWQHNILVKISKIWNSQGHVTLPEFLNPPIPNCPTTYTGGTKSPKSANSKLPHYLPWRHNILVKIPIIRNSQGQVTLPEFLNPPIPNCPTTYTGSTKSPKSGNAKLPHYLHWQHNILVKIPKIRNSQGHITFPEFLNPAMPNCPTYTSGTKS